MTEKGFVNHDVQKMCEKKYDFVGKFENGFAAVCINNKWGFIDTSGKEIIEIKYDGCHNFENGFALVRINKKWGFITENGDEIILHSVKTFSNGIANLTYTSTIDIEENFMPLNTSVNKS